MMAHLVRLVDGVLVCSCGLSHCHGCLCQHLPSLEPKYNLVDMVPRWQTAFAYYAYQNGYDRLTKLYNEKRSSMMHGILPKVFDVSISTKSYYYED